MQRGFHHGLLVREQAAPHCVRWVRRFLMREASDEPLADQARRFCEDLQRGGGVQEWQVRQAEQALRMFFVNFLKRKDWHRRPAAALVGEQGGTNPLAALEELRRRIRTRHYSYRTERTYADWVRRFFAYLAERQNAPDPRVDSDAVRDYLTHLAVRQRVSASSQTQALSGILFLCREVLGVEVEDLSATARAKRGTRLPVVLGIPETVALLGGMRGRTRLVAALIYGGGLRVSECCQLRVKDLDFDQGLVFVRSGKGNTDRSTLLAELGREELRAQLRSSEALYRADRESGLAGVWMPDALERKYPNAGRELAWFWVFPSKTLATDPRAGIVSAPPRRVRPARRPGVRTEVHATGDAAGSTQVSSTTGCCRNCTVAWVERWQELPAANGWRVICPVRSAVAGWHGRCTTWCGGRGAP